MIYDNVVIGAGIIGLYNISEKFPDLMILIIEKENDICKTSDREQQRCY
jgi:L-2-hydroxyglutarate oxidase LhgO